MADSLIPALLSAGTAFVASGGNPYVAAFAFAATLATGFISQALADKPEAPDFTPFSTRAQNRTSSIRQPITSRRVFYGVGELSGPLTFYEATEENRYHHMVITLCEGPIEGFLGFWIDGEPVALEDIDADGDVTAGKYADKLRIRSHTGETTQVADTFLTAATSADSNFRGRGVAYIYVRVDWDQDVFPRGLPDVSATIKGKKVHDPRTATTVFSDAAALAVRDFLSSSNSTGYGMGLAAARLDDTYFQSEANVCEEYVTTKDSPVTLTEVDASTDELEITEDVAPHQFGDRGQFTTAGTLPAGLSLATDYFIDVTREGPDTQKFKVATSRANLLAGTYVDITDTGSGTHTFTKKAEPRYVVSGLLETDNDPQKILTELKGAMAGHVIITGGIWRPIAGRYVTPTLTFDEDDLRGPISLETKLSRRTRFNAVKGVFVSPVNNSQPQDYPPVTDSTYETADGFRIWRELDHAYTSRASACQRLSKIELAKARREFSFTVPVSLAAMQLVAGDTVQFTIASLGWSSKVFEVVEWRFIAGENSGNSKVMMCALSLREYDSDIYTWASASDETTPAPASKTNLPNPWTVPAPTTFALTTDSFISDAGETVSRIKASWVAPADYLVVKNGGIELQFKRSADSTWEPSFSVAGSELSAFVPGVENDTNYDVRIRAVNHLGVRSSFQTTTNFKVGALSGGANSQRDYGAVTESIVSNYARGGVTAAHDKQLDYEGVT